jgi:hypothetical protein
MSTKPTVASLSPELAVVTRTGAGRSSSSSRNAQHSTITKSTQFQPSSRSSHNNNNNNNNNTGNATGNTAAADDADTINDDTKRPSTGTVYHNSGLEAWREQRAAWTSNNTNVSQYEPDWDSDNLDDTDEDFVMDCVKHGRAFPSPIPLSSMIDLLRMYWDDE